MSTGSDGRGGGDGGPWTVALLMMSCRALGRGVLDALLAALLGQAAEAGAEELRIPCLVTERNVPLRLALTAAGFRPGRGRGGETGGASGPGEPGQAGEPAVFVRALAGSRPALPDWAGVTGGPGAGGAR